MPLSQMDIHPHQQSPNQFSEMQEQIKYERLNDYLTATNYH